MRMTCDNPDPHPAHLEEVADGADSVVRLCQGKGDLAGGTVFFGPGAYETGPIPGLMIRRRRPGDEEHG